MIRQSYSTERSLKPLYATSRSDASPVNRKNHPKKIIERCNNNSTLLARLFVLNSHTKMDNSIDDELKERFAVAAKDMEADVLAELKSIIRLHSLDVQELWYKWESYSMKMGSDDMKLDIVTAKALKEDVQSGFERENRSKAHLHEVKRRTVATPRTGNTTEDVLGM